MVSCWSQIVMKRNDRRRDKEMIEVQNFEEIVLQKLNEHSERLAKIEAEVQMI